MFLENGWCREGMISIAENDFRDPLPQRFQKELDDIALMPKGTVGNERLWNHARAQSHLQSSDKLGRVSTWHRATTSGVLEDMDRPQVEISNQDKIDSIGFKKMPDSMFDSKHVDFSLGKTVEDEILGPKTWGAPKADRIP